MQKISFYSRLVQWAIILGAILHFGVWSAAIVTQTATPSDTKTAPTGSFSFLMDYTLGHYESEIEQLSQAGFNGLLWLSLPEVIFYGLIYWSLFQLFRCYQRGEIFARSSITQIRRTGSLFIAWPIVGLVYPPLLILSFKLLGLLQHGAINIGFGSDDLRLIVLGIMLTIAGLIMHEAKSLQEEQELTV